MIKLTVHGAFSSIGSLTQSNISVSTFFPIRPQAFLHFSLSMRVRAVLVLAVCARHLLLPRNLKIACS